MSKHKFTIHLKKPSFWLLFLFTFIGQQCLILYLDIKKTYQLCQDLRNVFENNTDKIYGLSKLAKWHEKVAQAEFKSFNTISRSIQNHYQTILNYFDNRSTNECFSGIFKY